MEKQGYDGLEGDGLRATSSASTWRVRVVSFLACAMLWNTAHAGPYELAGQRAATWLNQAMLPEDNTWGTDQDLKYLTAAEVALALSSWNRRGYEYYAALTWLANHRPSNTDFASRRVSALAPVGQIVDLEIAMLLAAHSETQLAPGNLGVGVNKGYEGSPLDTALALQAYYSAAGSTFISTSIYVSASIAYLKNSQLGDTDRGWAIGQESSSDPITTAHVLIALLPYRTSDLTLATPIADGLAALNAKVTSSSTVAKKSLAALANMRNSASSGAGIALLSDLMASQSADGSWGGDIYATALALRALAAGEGRDAPSLRTVVAIPDVKLRAAINAALSRNALDTLNQSELAQLTSLNISGQGITNLAGLQYAANLTYLDASYNSITSWTPVESLPQNPTTVREGNPGYPSSDADAPLPLWAFMVLGGLLFSLSQRRFSAAKRLT